MLKQYIHQTQRMSKTGAPISVIDPEKYIPFFDGLEKDRALNNEFRAYLAVAVSGGCRVTEALALKVGSINHLGQFHVKVLKKKSVLPVYRTCILVPRAIEIVQEYIRDAQKGPDDLLFTMHRTTILRNVKKHFGKDACCHSIARHSHVSYLLHNERLTAPEVAAEMSMMSHVIDYYNHANISVKQLARFKK